MKKGIRLTFSKGALIITAFALLVFSCINVAIQGESGLTGTGDNLRAISIELAGDWELRVSVFGSVSYLKVPSVVSEVYESAGNTICDLAYNMVASVRQTIENLKDHRLP